MKLTCTRSCSIISRSPSSAVLFLSEERIELAEQRLIHTKKRQKVAGSLFRVRQIYYKNMQTIVSLVQHLKRGYKPQTESFDMWQLLRYLMDLYSVRALEKEAVLELFLESCLPKKVTGQRVFFELLVTTMLSYMADHIAPRDTLKLSARLRNAVDGGFNLSFEFECNATEEITELTLSDMFVPKETYEAGALKEEETKGFSKEFIQYGIEISQFKDLVTQMKGTAETGTHESGRVFYHMEVQVENHDQARPTVSVPELKVVRKVRVNEYTTRWMPQLEAVLEEVKSPQGSTGETPGMKSGELFTAKLRRSGTRLDMLNDAKTKEMVRAKLRLRAAELASPKIRPSVIGSGTNVTCHANIHAACNVSAGQTLLTNTVCEGGIRPEDRGMLFNLPNPEKQPERSSSGSARPAEGRKCTADDKGSCSAKAADASATDRKDEPMSAGQSRPVEETKGKPEDSDKKHVVKTKTEESPAEFDPELLEYPRMNFTGVVWTKTDERRPWEITRRRC